MTRYFLFFPVLALIACSGDTQEDSGSETDTNTDTDTDTDVDTVSFPIELSFFDGMTGAAIEGGELCMVEPTLEEPCLTTSATGMIEFAFEGVEFTNFLSRLTHEDYYTALYTGRYDQDVHDGWLEILETSDAIEGSYWAFKPATVNNYLASGGIVAEEGKGVIVYFLSSSDGSDVDGAIITLENDAGESVGEVAYQSELTGTLNTELTATSTDGVVTIANVDPGEHILRVSHETLTCESGFAWISGVADVFTVPVEADTQTIGSVWCEAQ